MKMRTMMKSKFLLRTWLLCMCGLFPAAVSAQAADGEGGDAVTVVFRFVSDRDMFYYEGNGEGLDSLCRMLDPALLQTGSVLVDGYSSTKSLSKIRCNRVKSELIVRRGLREEHFTTRNLTGAFEGRYNVVVVTVPLFEAEECAEPEAVVAEEEPEICEEAVPEICEEEPEPVAEEPAVCEPEVPVEPEQPEEPAAEPKSRGTHLSLRANLLRWATLTPDAGVEWRVGKGWSVLVNGSYCSWSWNDMKRRYALWEIAPEVRRSLGREQRGYLGVMFKAGSFNYKLSETGREGNLMGGGITGGYVLRLNRALSLDFSVGLGYIHADCDKYEVVNGVRVRRGTADRNWWGPTSAGVSLVWTIF